MKVCDKCKKAIGEKSPIKIKGKEYELCNICIERIINWIQQPASGSIWDMFGGKK